MNVLGTGEREAAGRLDARGPSSVLRYDDASVLRAREESRVRLGIMRTKAVPRCVGAVMLATFASAVLVAASSAAPARALATGAHQPRSFTHNQYVRWYSRAVIGKTSIGVLRSWPPPYQSYHDTYRHRCYEWDDKGRALYNLCFDAKGILTLKVIE